MENKKEKWVVAIDDKVEWNNMVTVGVGRKGWRPLLFGRDTNYNRRYQSRPGKLIYSDDLTGSRTDASGVEDPGGIIGILYIYISNTYVRLPKNADLNKKNNFYHILPLSCVYSDNNLTLQTD